MARILYGIKTLAEALTHNVLGMAAGLFGFPMGGAPSYGKEIRNRFAGLTDRVFLGISRYIVMAQNAARLFTPTSAPAIEDIPRNPNLPVGTAYQASVAVKLVDLENVGPAARQRWITINVPMGRRPRNEGDVEMELRFLLLDIAYGDTSPGFGPPLTDLMNNFEIKAIERRGR